jgi:hypothetical protein
MAAAASGKGRGSSGGDWQRVSSVMPAGMVAVAAATAVLPSCVASAAMKTPAVTAMAGAQTTINNQLKAADGGGRMLAA